MKKMHHYCFSPVTGEARWRQPSLLLAALCCYCIAAAASVLLLSGCGDGDKPHASVSDTNQVYNPNTQDDDDRILNEEESVSWRESSIVIVDDDLLSRYSSRAVGTPTGETMDSSQSVVTSKTYRVANGGRQAFRIRPRFGHKGQTAIVVFSDNRRVGYRVKLHYANRVNSGSHNGFVFRLGTLSDFFAHSPYGRHPNYIYVYY